MFKKALILTCFLLTTGASTLLRAQASPTASRVGDLQAGILITGTNLDYGTHDHMGYGAYATFDFKEHWGVELNIRQVSAGAAEENLAERTYQIGGRYVRTYGRFKPYVRLSVGRGVFNFPFNQANLAYNMYSAGGGVDVHIIDRVNLRLIDYEYQRWGSFPPRGLQPNVISVGVAYHFK